MLWSTQPAPLLVLARFRAKNQLTKTKSHRVTPFWHNDTRFRVTVTFGARRRQDAQFGCASSVIQEASRKRSETVFNLINFDLRDGDILNRLADRQETRAVRWCGRALS